MRTHPYRSVSDALERIGCILCGDISGPIVIRENGYEGRRCDDCGLIYVSPRPTLERIGTLYSHDDAHVPSFEHFYGGPGQRLHARHTLALIRRCLPTPSRRYSVLEIGAGAGYFLDEARRAGFDVCAIELSSLLADFINSKLEIACERQPLSKASFGNRTFDVIYHCDVASHFYDPIVEFERTRAKLGPGGLVVFETGNFAELNDAWLNRIPTFQYPDHLFFYSEGSIRRLLDRTRFDVLHLARYSLGPEAFFHRWTSGLKQRAGVPAIARPETPRHGAVALTDALDEVDTSRSRTRRWLSRASQSLSFFCRYQVGARVPKGRRPQTLIVVARKRA